jgi:uncharacterized protein YrzB (UPF0473 family)
MATNNEREFVTLEDEEGNVTEFELIDEVEMNGTRYFAIIAVEDLEKDFCDYGIIKLVEENGEQMFTTIDDDAEYDKVADYFDEHLASEVDYDASIED